MSIQVGEKLPSIKLKRLGDAGIEEVDTGELFAGKKVVLFGVPGAFTPTCHKQHLPGFIASADELKQKGVEDIICLAVNDPFVTRSWGENLGAEGKVTLLPDAEATFTKAIGMDFDGSGAGLGIRSRRFSLIAENGVVKNVEVEEKPGDLTVTGASTCLTRL